MRKNYEPNPIIIDRAVELWKRLLAAPVYNNLAPGERHLPSELANALAYEAPKNNTPEILEAFGHALKATLLVPREGRDYFHTYLAVDYHPDLALKDAAEKAGLKMPFPIKTSMNLYDDCVGFSIGYAAPMVYHYPLSGNRWLVTDLYGGDITKVIALANAGVDTGLTIES